MGAGNAGASRFIALNGDQGGGNKKQGLPSYIGRVTGIDYNRTYGNNRMSVFYMNQLGGIGKGRSMFITGADGVRQSSVNAVNAVNDIFYSSTDDDCQIPCCSNDDTYSDCEQNIGCVCDQSCTCNNYCYSSGCT